MAVPSSEMRLAGRYRLRGILGRGGMGTVYRAEDLELGEVIALKVVSKGSATTIAAERQRDEVRLARRVTHPNVARTFDLGEHDNLRFITMELVDGASLRDVIESALPVDKRMVLVGHVALGLDAIHTAGIAHRDLKPENVLVSSQGVAKITDFGIARPSSSVAAGMTTGTPRYMAPEVLGGAPPTPAADVYAFGLVAVEVITGDRFRGGDVASTKRDLERRLGAAHEAIPMLLQCLAESPANRPKTVRPLGELLGSGRALSMAPLASSRAARARLCAAIFVADPSDAWLADSIPDHLLRGLSRSSDLEVIMAPLPTDDAPKTALARGADVVLLGSVQRAGDDLRISVRIVATADELTLWARTDVSPMALVPSRLGDMVSEIVLAVSDQSRPRKTTQKQDPRVTELLLRSAHEDHDPWRDFSTASADLAEEARRLAPDDPNVLAAVAVALLRGGGHLDADRFTRARVAAHRAVELDGASCDAQHALAVTLFLSNDALGALDCVRAVLRAAPAMGDVHGMLGAMAGDVGLHRDAVGRASLAIAMNPSFSVMRLVLALAREIAGEHREADRAIDEGFATTSMLARMLCMFAAARIAMWRGTESDIEALVAKVEPLRAEASAFVDPLLAALGKTVGVDEVLAAFGPLASVAKEWGRQYCLRLQFEVELSLHLGDIARATRAVEQLVSAGSYDEAWISRSPMAKRLPDVAVVREARVVIESRAAALRRKMVESGLVGAPRLRPIR